MRYRRQRREREAPRGVAQPLSVFDPEWARLLDRAHSDDRRGRGGPDAPDSDAEVPRD